jgi:Ca-activated chloride channel family protein
MTRTVSNGKVGLMIRPSRKAIGRQGGGVHLLVRAEPPAPPVRKERRPVALALVIDRSGSMGQAADNRFGPVAAPVTLLPGRPARGRVDTGASDKMSFVRAATLRLLDLMHDGDAVALVTFDDQAAVAKPLTVLDDRSRRSLADAVNRLSPGGSTYLQGGLEAGLEQLGAAAREHYGCKLVLLSDGQANVGEQRPAVLAEAAVAAARAGVTTSTLGVGFDYNIALMTALAEAGNGDFSHIGSLDGLDEILREEFTQAAEVTARDVRVGVALPERLAFGTNVNGYRQESTAAGFEVHLGDLVRPKEFLVEITTPVALEGDELVIEARASYRDVRDAPAESGARLALRLCDAAEATGQPVDDHVIGKLLVQLPARAEMDSALAYEAGDTARARSVLDASQRAMADVSRRYGRAAEAHAEMNAWRARLDDLTETAQQGGPLPSESVKTMYAGGYDLTRSRPRRPFMA